MRRFKPLFLVLVMAVLSATSAYAVTYQEGVRTAKDQNKPLYLYFYSDG
jgi:hypothetical protein